MRLAHGSDGSGTDDATEVEEFDEAGSASAARELADMPEGEDKWREQFAVHGDEDLGMTTEQLREEFGDVEIYVAFKKHPEQD